MRPVEPAVGKAVQVEDGEHLGLLITEVSCSFCQGRGKDPFGIMSWLSTCCVCGGGGTVQVRVPYGPCAYCRGTGAIKTFTCTVCRGTGYVTLAPGPRFTCPECRGRGEDPASALACLACRGRGWVSPETRK
jgi:DnaJ-class molecular chaperone